MHLFRRWEFWVAVAVVALDQATKAFVRTHVALHDSIPIVPGFFDLTHVQNSGAAFGFLNAVDFPFKATVLVLVATLALIGIAAYAARLSPHRTSSHLGLALIIGGAAGNLIDRLAVGYVVDFADVYWRNYHFWAFNVADSAITLGAIVMIFDVVMSSSQRPHGPAEGVPQAADQRQPD